MRSTRATLVWVGLMLATGQGLANSPVGKDCTLKGRKLMGKVKVVDSFPDLKIKVVQAFADLKVKHVDHFPDACGKWQMVETFPDFKVQFVEAFPDLTITYVDAFPGVP